MGIFGCLFCMVWCVVYVGCDVFCNLNYDGMSVIVLLSDVSMCRFSVMILGVGVFRLGMVMIVVLVLVVDCVLKLLFLNVMYVWVGMLRCLVVSW